jgi:adenosine kinase
MTFSGRFEDSIVPEQLDKIAVSFLVDDLEVRRGGTAANIAFSLAKLGHRPLLVASVGKDFDVEYRGWLDAAGVDTSAVRVSESRHTARFVCTTDSALAQISSFYPGAMSEAGAIDLAGLGEFDLVLISPDDPAAMISHTASCRDRGVPFAADPSQQLAFADGAMIRDLVDGATYLFSNDYEAALIEKKTGWTADEVRSRIGTQVTTRGKDGVSIYLPDGDVVEVGAIAGVTAVDPTGVGDSFRAGFLAGIAAGLGVERCAQVGCTIASLVVETTGTQEYQLDRASFIARLGDSYGEDAAAEVEAALDLPN